MLAKLDIYIAIALLFLGFVIYITCRQDVVFGIFVCISPSNVGLLEHLHIPLHYTGNILSYIFLFCLPDALWYFSLLLLQKYFYKSCSLWSKLLLVTAVLLPFVHELFQYFALLPGTFDMFDIYSYLLTLLVFLTLWRLQQIKLCKLKLIK
jgi:hypothetical protein